MHKDCNNSGSVVLRYGGSDVLYAKTSTLPDILDETAAAMCSVKRHYGDGYTV